jgi:hypothetical protein
MDGKLSPKERSAGGGMHKYVAGAGQFTTIQLQHLVQ